MAKLGIVKARLEHEVNAYIVTCADTKEAVVIDPGAPAEKLVDNLGGAIVKWIVATHAHPGHIAGKDQVAEATGGTTVMHYADAKRFLRSAGKYVIDGDELEFGKFKMQVLHTPGHTPGSVCLLVGNHLFSGDTLLAGGIGKQTPDTDLKQQMFSIGTRLLRLPPDTAIYPGHGPATSLLQEVRTSPVFRR